MSRVRTLILLWLHAYGLKWFGDVSRGRRGSRDGGLDGWRLSWRHVYSLPSVALWLSVDGLPLIRGGGGGIGISISFFIGIAMAVGIGIVIGDPICVCIGSTVRVSVRIVDSRTSIRTLFRMRKSHVKVLLIFLIKDLRAATHATSVFALSTRILPRRSHVF